MVTEDTLVYVDTCSLRYSLASSRFLHSRKAVAFGKVHKRVALVPTNRICKRFEPGFLQIGKDFTIFAAQSKKKQSV